MLQDLINIHATAAELVHLSTQSMSNAQQAAKFPLNTTDTGSCMPNKFGPGQRMIVAACILQYSDMERFIPAKTSI